MASITAVNNGDSGLQARTKINTNDTNLNTAIVALENRFVRQVINLVGDTDLVITNPYTLPVIPQYIQVKASDGTNIIGLYINVNQTTGDITLNSGSNFNNAILTIIGW